MGRAETPTIHLLIKSVSQKDFSMSNRSSILRAALMCAPLFLATAGRANELVVNGDFETGSGLQGHLTGWTSSESSLIFGTDQLHQSGSWSAFLGALSGSLSQTINTVVGATYSLSFWVSATPGSFDGEHSRALSALADGQVVETISTVANAPLEALDWTVVTKSFIATSEHTTLAFNFQNGDGSWALDAVSVSRLATPGPVVGAGLPALLGLALVAVRRRRPTSFT
jgi:hypothetical protein